MTQVIVSWPEEDDDGDADDDDGDDVDDDGDEEDDDDGQKKMAMIVIMTPIVLILQFDIRHHPG